MASRPGSGPIAALERYSRRLAARLVTLEARLDAGDESAWGPSLETARILGELLVALERRGGLLTTEERAAQLQVHPETLLEHMRRGEITPAVRAGKLIRWRGDEVVRSPVARRVTQRYSRQDDPRGPETDPGAAQADPGRARRRGRRDSREPRALGNGPVQNPRAGGPATRATGARAQADLAKGQEGSP